MVRQVPCELSYIRILYFTLLYLHYPDGSEVHTLPEGDEPTNLYRDQLGKDFGRILLYIASATTCCYQCFAMSATVVD